MKKLKHSKYRNTGLLFEALTRASMHEAMNPGTPQRAMRIIKRHFKEELLSELMLYRTLSGNTDNDPNSLLELSVQAKKTLDEAKLTKQRYDLVRSIKKYYNIDTLLECKVTDYKLQASIFKIFEYSPTDNPDDYLSSRRVIVESLGNKSNPVTDDVERVWADQEPDVRKLGFRILVEKFNQKYAGLPDRSKRLLSKYIYEDANSPAFKEYVVSEVGYIGGRLTELNGKVSDPVVKVKIDETINLLHGIIASKKITDEQLSGMIKYYELLEVLNNE